MDKINKALHGVIQPGSCYHDNNGFAEEWCHGQPHHIRICSKCQDSDTRNPDYFSKEEFWDAWEWIMSSPYSVRFENYLKSLPILFSEMHYKTFAKYLYDFLVAEGIIKVDG